MVTKVEWVKMDQCDAENWVQGIRRGRQKEPEVGMQVRREERKENLITPIKDKTRRKSSNGKRKSPHKRGSSKRREHRQKGAIAKMYQRGAGGEGGSKKRGRGRDGGNRRKRE